MIRLMLRMLLGGLLLVAALSLSQSQAQDKEFDLDEFRRLRRLETPLDFWYAVKFELDLGKPDIAARYLRGLMDKKPSEKDLVTILDKDGLTAILKLRNVAVWSANKKENEQARKDTEQLIQLATDVNKKRLADPERIRGLIAQLQQTPEEQIYAINELYKTGAAAVPLFIDTLLEATTASERLAILKGLKKMGPATIPPLLAALDSDKPLLKLDILDVLRQSHARYSREIVPFLWFVASDKRETETVRQRARKLLADFLEVPETRLPAAKTALTREAERYFQHEVTFGDPRAVSIWRWDGQHVVAGWPGASTVSASQAEEYFGQKFARQALILDPDYRPAQLISLSLAVDKAMEKAGPSTPLSRTSPEVAELLAKASSDLVMEMLDRAMKEKRSGLALASIRSLGDRAETRSKRPSKGAEPALVRALYYPDPRVQMAAATALLRIPGPPAPKTAARIVEILTRALSTTAAYVPGRKVLVALTESELRDRVRQIVLDAGGDPVLVSNGKDAMRQLKAHAGFEAILLDSTLPYPGLANLLAQLRQDVDLGSIPILLAAIPETRTSKEAASRYRELQARKEEILRGTRDYRALLQSIDKEEAEARRDVEQEFARDRRLTSEEKQVAYQRVQEKFASQREQTARSHPAASSILQEVPRLEKQMAWEAHRYDLESQVREAALSRFVRRYDHIQVVHTSLLLNPKGLEATLLSASQQAGVSLSPVEQKEMAEQAIQLLANLAEGQPPGYDIKPASNSILDALSGDKLSPEAQRAGIRAAIRIDGPRAQTTLSRVVLDGGRNIELRLAALRGLILNIQRQGALLSSAEINSLTTLARTSKIDDRLKDQLHHLLGALQPSERSTGERLRDYKPRPAPALPPPPPPEIKPKDD